MTKETKKEKLVDFLKFAGVGIAVLGAMIILAECVGSMEREGNDVAYNRGLEEGFQTGYNEGYDDGYEDGVSEGLDLCEEEFYHDGAYEDGYKEGYDDGYFAAVEEYEETP